jgi:hypothetical protein
MDVILRLCIFAAATQGFSLLDKQFAARGLAKPYYAVHVIHNAAIVLFTATDVMRSFVGPVAAASDHNWPAILICFALHAYHIRDYWSSLHSDDWLHHGLMLGVALPLSLLVEPTALTGMNLFFTTGLPGGISYAALFAERNGWLTRSQEKAINVPVNVWLRAPGCVANATLIVAAAIHTADWTQQTIALLIAALTYWNGLYFMQQVVIASQRQRLNTQ